MKRSLIILAAIATPAMLFAAPPRKKQKQKRERAAPEQPVAPDHPAPSPKETPSASNSWHTWTATGGQQLEAKFKALENGIVTVQDKDGRTVRFPAARLTPADQQFAQ